MYLPLSGGVRQCIDALFASVAILLGKRIYVHHHSFAYLNSSPLYARIVLRILNSATHIVLGNNMGVLLGNLYGIPAENIRVISNSAFLEEIPRRMKNQNGSKKLVVGFLSNITQAKGCFDFIELVNQAVAQGLPVEGIMAGPVQAGINAAFDEAVRKSVTVTHIGPVYAEEKTKFFDRIDILVFPTRYVNEAEPVTIWEALASSAPVIALSRGCISGMIPDGVGWVIDDPSCFIEQGIKHLRSLIENPEQLATMKNTARAEFESARSHYRQQLDTLLKEMTI